MTEGQERRAVKHTIDELYSLFTTLSKALIDHMSEELAENKRIRAEVTENAKLTRVEIEKLRTDLGAALELRKAFPVKDGFIDTQGHRIFHETLIEEDKVSADRRKRIKDAIIEKLVTGIVYGSIFLILLGAKSYIVDFIKGVTTSTGVGS